MAVNILLIKYDFKTCSSDEVKFIDVLTVFKTAVKFRWSDIQRAVSKVEEWFECDLFKLNENKYVKKCG